METAGLAGLSRQSGLMREMDVVAQNIANANTPGYRREGIIFSEYVTRIGEGPSLSLAYGNARHTDQTQAGLTQTGGTFDLAIQGDGFFRVATPDGDGLTRAGVFLVSAEGVLVTPDGHQLLDAGGAPVSIPPNVQQIAVALDGAVTADGVPIAQIGLWQAVDPALVTRQQGTMFRADDVEPVDGGTIVQGFLEDSNVSVMSEMARMIAVQRAYELGQSFLEAEHERQKTAIQIMGR